MSHDANGLPHHWSLEIFRMTRPLRQQRALRAFARIDAPGLHALGVVRDDAWLVIVDATSIADAIRARRIIGSLDPLATQVYRARHRRLQDILPATESVVTV